MDLNAALREARQRYPRDPEALWSVMLEFVRKNGLEAIPTLSRDMKTAANYASMLRRAERNGVLQQVLADDGMSVRELNALLQCVKNTVQPETSGAVAVSTAARLQAELSELRLYLRHQRELLVKLERLLTEIDTDPRVEGARALIEIELAKYRYL